MTGEGLEVAAVTVGGVAAVIVEVVAEVTRVGLIADHAQEVDQGWFI